MSYVVRPVPKFDFRLVTNKKPKSCSDTHFDRVYMFALRLRRKCNGNLLTDWLIDWLILGSSSYGPKAPRPWTLHTGSSPYGPKAPRPWTLHTGSSPYGPKAPRPWTLHTLWGSTVFSWVRSSTSECAKSNSSTSTSASVLLYLTILLTSETQFVWLGV